jgi:hypothetical protein
MFIWYFRFCLFKLLSLFGLASKYLKTDDIKQDAMKGINKFLNFDEFRKKKTEFTPVVETHNDELVEPDVITSDIKTKDTSNEVIEKKSGISIDKQVSVCTSSSDSKYDTTDLDNLDLTTFKEPTIYGIGDKKLLLLDDVGMMYNLYKITFGRINRMYNVNVENTFSVVVSIGKLSGYMAYKYILNNKIDYALLDITLGDLVRNKLNNSVEIDGIDIAIKLLELNPDVKFKFISAHTLNKRNYTMINYFNKFESATHLDISKYYIYKNGDMCKDIYNFLYGETK